MVCVLERIARVLVKMREALGQRCGRDLITWAMLAKYKEEFESDCEHNWKPVEHFSQWS